MILKECASGIGQGNACRGGAAEKSIGDYIDGLYNVERLHSYLDYVSPIEFELKAHVTAVAA